MEEKKAKVSTVRGLMALSPIVLFLLLYVVVSVLVGDFYKMPLSVALIVSSVWAVTLYRGHSLFDRLMAFSSGAGHPNIIYMIWIFILAGGFASLAREIGSVEATVNATLSVVPAQMVLPGLFLASCFISMAVGTSVGTVVAITPLAMAMAADAGSVPLFVAVVLGGSFFGDNLSFISDTTIAATRSQGCDMADKFKSNFRIVLPAALLTVVLYVCLSGEVEVGVPHSDKSPWLMLPYIVVIVTALMRMNVTLVLGLGILTSLILGIIYGYEVFTMAGYMGAGIDSMGNLIIVTLLAAGMLEIIKRCGGIDWLLGALTKRVKGVRGGQICISMLVSLVNVCTANNTVAIITVGSLSKEIAARFGISPQRSASLLDTCSCVVQCLIPYGAQTLLATSLASISPGSVFCYLYYPFVLAICVIVSIAASRRQKSGSQRTGER